ncbi:cucumisin-like [Syzygium oleosum]|uniref:cucumisin-like n=1 Tax=Syzygium oleosum TaxID=219896 RepID=UPI0011D23A67|nr:cucumisin-like [Syzygium oleosum]
MAPLSKLLLMSFISCVVLVYVVYMGGLPKQADFLATSVHTSMLQEVVGSRASESLVHSYSRSFHGFAARLTEDEMAKIAGMEGVVSVFPSERHQLQTTRSWDFLGFSQSVQRLPTESDLIVGMLDTGIWPESDSFNDEGFGRPPAKWKGTCQTSNFTCNNKIIGAKYYRQNTTYLPGDIASPRDSMGHGSHTSSIAAGGSVSGTSLFGLGSGTARGGVPSARIAVYKVCWTDGCYDADMLAAFDDAIADGVDIISISIGSRFPRDYFTDSIAIGSFHAMKQGILTSAAAGNSGPKPASTTNFSPWFLSVAASTIDRKFVDEVLLGNGKSYEGVAINTFDLNNTMYPMIYGGDAPNIAQGFNSTQSRLCAGNSLNSSLVKGKIVLCDSLNSGDATLTAGAAGSIMQGLGVMDFALTFPVPASLLNAADGSEVSDYMNSTRNSTATIFKSTQITDSLAPAVVSFSSRGPSPIARDILKPDLASPGVDILAAWSPASTVTGLSGDPRHVSYNIISGTSMACPHATGAAAYVKTIHPTWSPAAIKSALMTTASPMSPLKNTDAEFAYGAGNINPLKAANPGLVYDAKEADYVQFLCGQGYSTSNLRLITGEQSNCSDVKNATVWDLNLPTFAVSTQTKGSNITGVFHRTVTNVGNATSTYKATVTAPQGFIVRVEPQTLTFESILQQQSFVVTVEAILDVDMISASLVWDDGLHQVRSPIVAFVVSS